MDDPKWICMGKVVQRCQKSLNNIVFSGLGLIFVGTALKSPPTLNG